MKMMSSVNIKREVKMNVTKKTSVDFGKSVVACRVMVAELRLLFKEMVFLKSP
jgi:hypothetical protein